MTEQEKLSAIRELHKYTPAGAEYKTLEDGSIVGVEETFWCPECGCRLWTDEDCKVMKILNG